MMLELVKEIIDIVAVAVPLIISLVIAIVKLYKNIKLKKASENLIEVEFVIKRFMEYAESFINYSGKDKKEWVMVKVNQYCIEHKIPYDERVVEDLLEKFIYLSKVVNKRDKDMVKLWNQLMILKL